MLGNYIFAVAREHIPQREIWERNSAHPWVNRRVVDLVLQKRLAEGTDKEVECRKRCSEAIMEEYGKYIQKERCSLLQLPRGGKGWWSKSKRLMQKRCAVSSIPALRGESGEWVLDPKEKADLYVRTMSKKHTIAEAVQNEYTVIDNRRHCAQIHLPKLTEKAAEEVLSTLNFNSGTGPDQLPTRLLRQCAKELAVPVLMLTLMILTCGEWPHLWAFHWMVPIFKKNNVFTPGNYRGVHLTSQLSKVVERLLNSLITPFLTSSVSLGQNQFAYTEGRGARDVLALMLIVWTKALAAGRKIGVFCSDVSGAFDRVKLERIVAKLQKCKLHPQIVSVLTSWLQQRAARVVVGGKQSDEMT